LQIRFQIFQWHCLNGKLWKKVHAILERQMVPESGFVQSFCKLFQSWIIINLLTIYFSKVDVQVAIPSDFSKGLSENVLMNSKFDVCKSTKKSLLSSPLLRTLFYHLLHGMDFELKCPFKGNQMYSITNYTAYQPMKALFPAINVYVNLKILVTVKRGSSDLLELVNCVIQTKLFN